MPGNKPTKINKDDVIAIATQDLRLASLLYDYVCPALYKNEIDDLPNEVRYHPGNIMDRPDDIGQKLIQEEFDSTTMPHLNNLVKILESITKGGEKITFEEALNTLEKTEPTNINYLNTFVRAIYVDLTRDGIRSVPLFYNHLDYDDYFSVGDQNCLQIELFNYPLIDTTGIEWKQVLEIRNGNKEFHKQIRDFRLFLIDNYVGKDTDYVYDDLCRKIDMYEEQCKHYGVRLKNTNIKILLDPTTYTASAALSSLSILSSDPLIIGIAGLTGLAIDVGRMMITVSDKQMEYDNAIQNQELAYLVEIRKLENNT
ncbi:MAG: hypothetical protein IH964_06175 [Candidatus Dadabacteria bacterium]|nr:hypothetical protein [Candidatus Dadabacteria bacterium]MCH7951041.1 hypothetical protein [Candidatus Dadabacteria bacterium]